MQAKHGLTSMHVGFVQGQLRAIWTHRVTDREAAAIVRAQIPVLVLHGRHRHPGHAALRRAAGAPPGRALRAAGGRTLPDA